jgi:hypothetical protein
MPASAMLNMSPASASLLRPRDQSQRRRPSTAPTAPSRRNSPPHCSGAAGGLCACRRQRRWSATVVSRRSPAPLRPARPAILNGRRSLMCPDVRLRDVALSWPGGPRRNPPPMATRLNEGVNAVLKPLMICRGPTPRPGFHHAPARLWGDEASAREWRTASCHQKFTQTRL